MTRTPILLSCAVALLCSGAASAAPYDWDNTGGDYLWDNPTNWDNPGFPNATTDTATFSSAAGGVVGTVNLNGNRTVGALTFSNPGGTYTLAGAGNTLTLDDGLGAGALFHSGAASNVISTRIVAANLVASVTAGVLRLANTAVTPNGNSFTGTSAFTVGTGATLQADFAGTGSYSLGTSALAGARVVLNGGTLNLNGLLTPNGLTAQFFSGANHDNAIDGALTSANPDFIGLGRTNARQHTYTPATLGAPNAGQTAALAADATAPGVAGFNGGAGAGNPYPGFYYDNSGGGSGAPFGAEGFTSADNLSVRFTGKINITTAGTYTFGTRSDDASALYVDGIRVVNNNNFQGMTTRTGTIALTSGLHDIMVVMCENGGGAGLDVYYGGADTVARGAGAGVNVIIPADVLRAGQGRISLANPISVTDNATINVNDADAAIMGALDIDAGRTLTTGGYGLSRFTTTTLNGAGANTYGFNAGGALGAADIATGRLINGAGNSATIVKTGTGNLILDDSSAAPTIGGGVAFDIQAGRLVAVSQSGQANPLGAAGATIALNSAGTELELISRSGNVTFDNAVAVNQNATIAANSNANAGLTITLGSAARPLSIANGVTATFDPFSNVTLLLGAGIPASTGSLVKAGQGALQLSGVNAYTGSTLVSKGTLQVNAGASITASSGITVNSGTTLTLAAAGAVAHPVPLSVTGTLNLTATGAITANNLLTMNSGSTLTLAAADAMAATNLSRLFFGPNAVTTLNLTATNALSADISVYDGNRTYISNATAVDQALKLFPGNTIEVTTALTGTGTITKMPGVVFRATGGTVFGAQLPASAINARDVLQINTNNVANIGAIDPGAIIEIYGADRQLANSAVITLSGQYLTGDGSSRTITDGAQRIDIGPLGVTIAATTGQGLTIAENITTNGNPVTIGTFRPLNNLFKAAGNRFTHTANNWTGSTVSVTGGAHLVATPSNAGTSGFNANLNPTIYNGALRIDTGTASFTKSATVGDVTTAGFAELRVGRTTASYATTMLLDDPLARLNQGTLSLVTTNNSLGADERIRFVTNSEAPARLVTSATINMVAPWIVNASSGGRFVDYDPATTVGFTNAAYDGNVTDFTGSTDTTIKQITAGALTDNNPATVAALRTTQNISGTNPITIATGGLIIDSSTSRTISKDLAFGANEAIIWSGGGAAHVISGKISGSGGLTKFGPNSLTLSNTTNDFTGPVTINQLNLIIASDSVLGNADNDLIFNGGALRMTAGITLPASRSITLNAGGGTLETEGAITATVNGVISGAGPLFKTVSSGTGTLILGSTANTYQGGTLVNGGVLQVAADGSLGDPAGYLVINNATLRAGASFSTARDTYFFNTATIDTNGFDLAHSGEARGSGGLTKIGLGTLTLSGPNAYAGTTSIGTDPLPGGILRITHDHALGFIAGDTAVLSTTNNAHRSALELAGGITVRENFRTTGNASGLPGSNGVIRSVSGNNTLSGTITLVSGGGFSTFGVDPGATLTLSGIVQPETANDRTLTVQGAGDGFVTGIMQNNAGRVLSFTKAGSSTWTLSNSASTYTGTTTINAGTLSVPDVANNGSPSPLGAGSSLVFGAAGATLQFTGTGPDATNRAITLTGTGTFDITNAAGALSLTGPLGGGGGMSKTGPGTLTLTNPASTYTGTTTINAGTLSVPDVANNGSPSPLGAGSSLVFGAAGATLQFTGTGPDATNRAITLTGTGTFDITNAAGALSLTGPLGGGGGMGKTGPGTLILTSGANSYTGTTDVLQGTLRVDGSIASSSLTTVYPGARIIGTGTVGPLLILGELGPGASVGTLGAADTTWGPDGSYRWEINHFDGTAGIDPGWDLLNVTGGLTVTATPADPFVIYVDTLSGALPGPAAGLLAVEEQFRIVHTTAGLSMGAPGSVVVQLGNYYNNIGGNYFMLIQEGNDLYLRHAPEPATVSLLALGALALLRRRNRRR